MFYKIDRAPFVRLRHVNRASRRLNPARFLRQRLRTAPLPSGALRAGFDPASGLVSWLAMKPRIVPRLRSQKLKLVDEAAGHKSKRDIVPGPELVTHTQVGASSGASGSPPSLTPPKMRNFQMETCGSATLCTPS